MNYKPITNFSDVILFSLQQKLQVGARAELTFNEIWRACEKAGKNFVIPRNAYTHRKQFVAEVFEYIKRLEMERKIDVHSIIQDRVDHITLTEQGEEFLRRVIYTNQEIMQQI